MAWGVPKIGASLVDATGDFTLAEPAGVAQGDLMIACVAWRGNAAITPPAGWTQVVAPQNSGDTDTTNGIASGGMWYIVRGASAPALTFTRTAGDVAICRIVSYSGGAATPLDAATGATLGAVNITVTTASITTAEAGELIVAMTSGGDNYSVSAFDAATDPTTASGATDTTTAPTDGTWLERSDVATTTGADGSLGIADAVRATAGATGTIQATMSGAGRSVMIAAAFKLQVAPTVALNTPNDAATGVSTTPNLLFTGTDTNADEIEYQVQLHTVNTYYFNGSDAAATDPDAVWTNDANAFDGLTTTSASVATTGSTASNFLLAEGTNAPTTGSTITQVRARIYATTTSDDLNPNMEAAIYTNALGELLGSPQKSGLEGWGSWATLSTPSGDWTWQKINDLEVKVYRVGGILPLTSNAFRVEVEVTAVLIDKLSVTPDATFAGTGDPHPWPSGNQVTYTVQAGDVLAANTTYYWRVRGLDPLGSNSYGAWSATRSFTTTAVAAQRSIIVRQAVNRASTY